MDARDELIGDLYMYLAPFVPDTFSLKNELHLIASKYEITERCTEVGRPLDDQNDILVARFLIAKTVQGCTSRTIEFYGRSIRKVLCRINKNIDEITPDDMRRYIAMRTGRDHVKKVTVGGEMRSMGSLFAWLAAEELVPRNIMLRVDHIKKEKVKKEALTEVEIEKLRMAVRNERESMVIEFLLSTGCRVSELVQIKMEEIEGERVLVHGKGQKDRCVYLNARAQLSLERYLSLRRDESPYLLPSGLGKDLPAEQRRGRKLRDFTTNWWIHPEMVVNDKAIDKASIQQMLGRMAKRAGVEKANPHKFRRTCATLALRRGMPIEQVSKMLGHEQIATTQVYLDLPEQDLAQAHKKYVL